MSAKSTTWSAALTHRSFPWQAAISLAVLVALMVLAIAHSGSAPSPPYDLDSAESHGLRALRLWLEEMGYRVERTGARSFALPRDANLFFVYPNAVPFSASDADIVQRWVEDGGTLVLIGSANSDLELSAAFGVQEKDQADFTTRIAQSQPLLPYARAGWSQVSAAPDLDLDDEPGAVAVLASDSGGSTAALQHVGHGVVWHLSQRHDFTNGELANEDQAALLPALLRRAPVGGNVVFDAYHMFGQLHAGQDGIASLQDWLYRTTAGWATLFGLATILVYLLLQGTRLGPPLPDAVGPTQHGIRRREAAEFVRAMALLQRRSRQSDAVAHHHRQRLKIGLGRRLLISPELPDDEFVQRLPHADPALTPEQIQTVGALLRELGGHVDDSRLVRAVARVDEVLKEIR